MSWLNTDELRISRNTMPEMRTVLVRADRSALTVSLRASAASAATLSAPKAAASDGVAQPSTMKPTTQNTTRPSGRILKTSSRRRWRTGTRCTP